MLKAKGSAQDNINLKTLENEKFPFPPVDVQEWVVTDVEEIRRSLRQLETVHEQSIASLFELKQSLLRQAFSGKLTAGKTETEASEATA